MAKNQEPTLQDLYEALAARKDEWLTMLVNPKLKFEAEMEWVMQSCAKKDRSIKCALGDFQAVENALLNVAGVGVSVDPSQKLAYVLERDGRMVYDLSYMGLMWLATSSGSLEWVQAHRVYEKDTFELNGYDSPPIHKRNPFAKPDQRGAVIGVYTVAKTPRGDYLVNTMPIEEIHAIRARSSAWKNGQTGPWKTDPAEMEKKTVVKNAWKYWPDTGGALARAIEYLNTDGGQGIDLTPADEQRTAVAIWTGKVNAAADGPAVAALWTQAREEFRDDPETLGEVRNLVAARNKALGVQPQKKPPTQEQTPEQIEHARVQAEVARILAILKDAADYGVLEDTGPAIDKLPPEAQIPLNLAYNERLKFLDAQQPKD